MPNYDFRCESCDKTIEVHLDTHFDGEEIRCECGKLMKYVFSAKHGQKLIGKGFYENDYKRK